MGRKTCYVVCVFFVFGKLSTYESMLRPIISASTSTCVRPLCLFSVGNLSKIYREVVDSDVWGKVSFTELDLNLNLNMI